MNVLKPTTIVLSGIFFVITELAPIIQSFPIVTSPRIFAPHPIIVFSPTT